MSHPLFQEYPQLSHHLPVVTLADLPTPVQSLSGLLPSNTDTTGSDNLWIKRDDLTNAEYGGNKVRKLEFIIADALRKKKHTIVTMGAIGTNHGVATATFCQKNQLKTQIFLFDQPITNTVIKNLKDMIRQGAQVIYRGSILKTALSYYTSRLLSPCSYHLPAGGSNIMGCVAFVNAAFELKQQIEQGVLPEPETIICPVGSSGTLAGLTLGCQLAGLKSEVIGVRVAPSHLGPIAICTAETAQVLMRKTYRYLCELSPSIPRLELREIQLNNDYFAGGYGVSSEAGDEARRIFRASGIELESTYTAKAAAAALAMSYNEPQKNILYWHTFNSAVQDSSAVNVSQQSLPSRLKERLQMQN